MQVTGILARPLYAALPAPMRSRGDVGYTEFVHSGSEFQRITVVEVQTDTGATGVTLLSGDASAWVEAIAFPALLDADPRAIRHCRAALDTTLRGAPEAFGRTARGHVNRLEFALWDLLGKSAGLPLFRLLGGSSPVVEVYAGGGSLCWNPLPLLLRELEQLLEQGFRAVKIKIGHGPEEDAAIVRTLRQAAGPDVRLMVDANRAYDLPGALRLARVLEEEHIDWFEEPFPYDDPECWRTLRRRTHVPLAGGEGFSRIGHAAEAVREGMLQVLQCDAGGFGLEALLAIGSLAAEAGVALTPHCCNSGIGFVVGCHLQTALPNRALQEYETFDSPFVHGLFTERPAVIDGKVTLPETPGLGITLNEDVIDRYLVR